MTRFIQTYGIGFSAVMGLLCIVGAFLGGEFAALAAGGIWLGAATIAAHIAQARETSEPG